MLTVKQIEAIKPETTIKRKNVMKGGLYISCSPVWNMNWWYRYKLEGNQYWYLLGKYRTSESSKAIMTLKQAVSQFYIEKSRVESGINIQLLHLQQRKEKPVKAFTLGEIIPEWIEKRQGKVVKATWDKELGRVKNFILPKFANKKLEDLTTKDIYTELKKVAESKSVGKDGRKIGGHETAKRTARHFTSILNMAMMFGYINHNVAEPVANELPDHEIQNRIALETTEELGEFMFRVNNDSRCNSPVGIAVRLMPHIFVRSSELLTMEWKDIDLKKKEWNRVVNKTKKKGVSKHKVFLSEQAIYLINLMKSINGNKPYVFYSPEAKTKHLSPVAILNRVRGLGYDDLHIHGFRASARTLGVQFEKNTVVIEKCLAHVTKEPLGESYDRTTYFQERKEFMDMWSNGLDTWEKQHSLKQANNVIRLMK